MAAYAALEQLKQRAGVLRDRWDLETVPGNVELEGYLSQSARDLDVYLRLAGVTLPVTDAVALGALANVNADMGLLLALDATWPGRSAPDAVAELRAAVSRRVDGYRAALEAGSLPALALLVQALEQAGQGGASDWHETDLPGWTYPEQVAAEPRIRRGMRF